MANDRFLSLTGADLDLSGTPSLTKSVEIHDNHINQNE